jgi:hypothetical protein
VRPSVLDERHLTAETAGGSLNALPQGWDARHR